PSTSPSNDAPESQMGCGRVHVFRMASRRPVAAAVIRGAQMRAAFYDFAGNLGRRQTGIVAVLLTPTAWIFWNATGLLRVRRVLAGPPICGPFPDIADHVVDAVAVRRKRRHRRGTVEAILAFIFVREISLPGICHVLAAGRKRVAPGE